MITVDEVSTVLSMTESEVLEILKAVLAASYSPTIHITRITSQRKIP